mmetsp:Transcript_35626/g.102376  ORF Transcript_35626/g.102376 Transcript_35626/m.102376 type:complete len:236 (-) Transcript_35626:259-966(-)
MRQGPSLRTGSSSDRHKSRGRSVGLCPRLHGGPHSCRPVGAGLSRQIGRQLVCLILTIAVGPHLRVHEGHQHRNLHLSLSLPSATTILALCLSLSFHDGCRLSLVMPPSHLIHDCSRIIEITTSIAIAIVWSMVHSSTPSRIPGRAFLVEIAFILLAAPTQHTGLSVELECGRPDGREAHDGAVGERDAAEEERLVPLLAPRCVQQEGPLEGQLPDGRCQESLCGRISVWQDGCE